MLDEHFIISILYPFLNYRELISLNLINKLTNQITNDNLIWKYLMARDFKSRYNNQNIDYKRKYSCLRYPKCRCSICYNYFHFGQPIFLLFCQCHSDNKNHYIFSHKDCLAERKQLYKNQTSVDYYKYKCCNCGRIKMAVAIKNLI